ADAGRATITVGTLCDSVEQVGGRLVAAYREHHPGVHVRVREADFTDPSAGLRAGLVDVALTRAPFDDTGIASHVLRDDPVGVVLRADDPLADREGLHSDELADRPWFRLPDDVDPVWRAYWSGPDGRRRDGTVVRTVHECLQAVRWNGTVGLAPLTHALPDGLTCVPLVDQPPSPLVVAWAAGNPAPLVRSFTRVAVAVHRSRTR
ncbi:MAG: LysR family substrate-binding domain-containing protein, partial [Saccharothrix sp.]|nr:LysR family substrate-binding domain-containing protein [Saccharothrix sp.]